MYNGKCKRRDGRETEETQRRRQKGEIKWGDRGERRR
jgi:hypothetical protein